MSAQTEFDLGSLIWVKGEIDQALDKSRQCLAKFASSGDNAELKFAQTHLHQVRGAVEMVGLAGAARFAEEMEVSVGMVERGEAPAAVLPVVAEATGSLAQYLESLVNGAPDLALKLLPGYRRVRQARGETSTTGADLFFPSLSGSLPAGLSPLPLDAATLAQLLKNSRSRFEAGLLKWLKGDQREGCQWMMQAFLAVSRSQTGSLQRGFWWAVSAMVEGSMDNRAALDIDLKQLYARLNQQLKRLTEGGGKVAERLFRDVLYVVAKMDTQSPHCAGVRRAFELTGMLPAGALEDDAQQLAAMQTARELRELINQAKENWSRIGGGSMDKLPVVQKQLADLSARGTKLGINGFKPLAIELARSVGALASVPPEKQALEIATALLLLENALMVFPEQSTEFPAQAAAMQARLLGSTAVPEVTLLDEVSRRAQERLLMTQVAQEIQANLTQIEQVLDDFFRDSATRGELVSTDAQIRQIRGALSMLDEKDALALLNACADIVKRNQSEDYAASSDELEFLAEAFSSLGFYIDAIKREDAERARIIAPWLQRIRGEAPAEASPSEAELIAAELEAEPEAVALSTAAQSEEESPTVTAEAPPALVETAPAAPPVPVPAAVSDAAVDAELLEVYLEEAVEVLATINEHMQIVHEQPTNRDALTVVRRAFHTLKGSGRMVGLNQLGEVAWAVEQVMNKWLQEERRATPHLMQLVDDAARGFSGWVDELKQSGSALVEASALFELADRLKSGEETEEPVAAPEPVAESPEAAEPTEAMIEESVAAVFEEPAAVDLDLGEEALAATHEAVEVPLDLVLDTEMQAEATEAADTMESVELELPAEPGLEPYPEPAAQIVSAEAAEATATPSYSGTPIVEDEAADITVGSVVISRALFGIFLDEAYRHFATLNDAFIDFGARGEVRPAFVHAAHTLCGIANTTGFTSLGELGHAIELALIAHQHHAAEPTHEDREALSLAIDKVGAMLGQISRHQLPGEELQTVAMLTAQANRLKDLAESRTALAESSVAEPEPVSATEGEAPATVAEIIVPAHADIELHDLDLELHEDEESEALTLDLSVEAGPAEHPTGEVQEHAEALHLAPAQPEAAEHELELTAAAAEEGLDLELTLDEEPLLEVVSPAEHEEALLLGSEEVHDLDIELTEDEELLVEAAPLAEAGEATEAHEVAPPILAEVVETPLEITYPQAVVEPEPEPVAETFDGEPELVALAEPEAAIAIELDEAVAALEHGTAHVPEEAESIVVPQAQAEFVETEPAAIDEDLVALLPAEEMHEPPLLLDESPDFVEVGEAALLEEEEAEEGMPLVPEAEPYSELPVALAPVALDETPLPIEPSLLTGEEALAGEAGIGPVELAPVDEAIVVEPHAEAVEAASAPTAAAVELATLLGGMTHPTPTEKDGVGSVALPGGDRLAEITVQDELDDQLLPIFLEEAQELMPQIAADLRKLREEGQAAAAMDSLKRSLHTLKGSARMAGAMRLGEATHNLESRLLNAGESLLPALVDELDIDYDAIVELHDRLVHGEPEVSAEAEIAAPLMIDKELAQVIPVQIQQGQRAAGPAQPLGLVDPDMGKTTVRVRADLVDRLVNQAGEVAIARTRIESEMLALKRSLLDLTDNVARLRGQLREIEIQAESQMQSRMAHAHDLPDFDPLEFDRFSRLQELTRFMAESVNDVATVQHNLLKNLDESSSALQQQSRLTRDLQQELMRVRMVPFSSLSERMYRLVRQTGKETGKKVNLELRGGRVEIDRSVLEKMVSPFEHMLRNAIDHGLETPDVRVANGKTEFGEILVEARQEGNELVLTLRDDGAGLNLDRIRAKGFEKGLLEQGVDYSDSQIMHLIFAAGFSTASEVTQLSGRGIGMDVVKAEIEDLGGRVELNSTAGQGTVFTIHLPLTLAVTQTVLVKVGEKTYAIPSVMVEQVQELKLGPLEKLYQSRQAEWMGNVYPFHYLPRLLGDNERTPEQKRYNTIILLRSGIQRIALHVDELIRNQEVVVKNIGPQLVRVAGVAGATVLGNGEIVLILNPLALSQRRAEAPVADFDASVAAAMPTPEEMLQTAPVVMVVDDSLTVRKITGRLLAREGYQVVTAKDGVDALQQLQDVRPAVMLLDVEMPRMDGFELTRNLRVNADTRDIPIIMITSRTADKHKNYAFELGVNVFLGKPYQEDELLEHIRRLIGEEMPIA